MGFSRRSLVFDVVDQDEGVIGFHLSVSVAVILGLVKYWASSNTGPRQNRSLTSLHLGQLTG